MGFEDMVLASAMGVILVLIGLVSLALIVLIVPEAIILAIRAINRGGTALMNKITGMDTYTRRSEREKERDDWWKDA